MLFSQLFLLILPVLVTTQQMQFTSFNVDVSKPSSNGPDEQRSISVTISHERYAGMKRYGISPRIRTCRLQNASWTPSTDWMACGSGSNGFWVRLKRQGVSDWLVNVLTLEWSAPPERGPPSMLVSATNATLSSNTASINDGIFCTNLSPGGGDISCKLFESSKGPKPDTRHLDIPHSLNLTKFRLQKYPPGGSGTCQFTLTGSFPAKSIVLPAIFSGFSTSPAPRSSTFTCDRSWPCKHSDGNFKIDIPCTDGFSSTLAYSAADRPSEKNREIWHISPQVAAPLWFEGLTEMTAHFGAMLNIREFGVPLEPGTPDCKNSVCDFPPSIYGLGLDGFTFNPARGKTANMKGAECGGMGTPQCPGGQVCKQQPRYANAGELGWKYNQLGRCTKS